ncbi:MAG: nucleoside hydrolase [Stappiaceae bacterium]
MPGNEKTTPLIVDTDGGIDDALALMMLSAHGRPPSLITTSFGNVELDQATDNILDTLAILDLDCPVHKGAAQPLSGERVDAVEIHGEDGLAGAVRPSRSTTALSEKAVAVLCENLSTAAQENAPIDLLMLGPLTNLALAISIEPALIRGIGQLTIMGGTCFGRGNITPAAEFNIFADPEAAAVIFERIPLAVLVPWEPCVDNPVPGARVDAFLNAAKPGATHMFIKALCDQGRAVHQQHHNKDALVLPDPLAAAVLLDGAVVATSRRCPVLVECAGQHTRGATIPVANNKAGTKRPDVDIVETIDPARLEQMFEATIVHMAGQP